MPYSRRRFLKTTAVAVAGASLFDVRELLAAGPYTRLDVGPLTASSPTLVSYGNAITAMKALPSSNPLSWAYQAAIHGTTLPGSFPAWNTCQHGTPYFWSWHRMYLYWFERIIRKMSGDANWALPYWNYESSSERQLPAPFRVSGSPLYTPNRGAGWNAGTASLSSSAVATSGFMPEIPYFTAQNNCESTPHAAVHVSIGGWMGSVPTAAQDPIFYLHHANIDRWWNLWLKQGGGRTDPLSDAAWKTTKFLFFDEYGAQKWMTGCDVLRCAQQLNYTYENEGTQVNQYCLKPLPWVIFDKFYLIEWPPFKLPPGPDPGPIEINVREMSKRLMDAANDESTDVTLEIEGVEADRQPNVFWEVYVGLPKGTAPNPESAHYVGNIALFGHGVHDEHQHGGFRPAKFLFKADRALQNAMKRNESGQLSLTFVARGAEMKGKPAAAVGTRNAANLTVGKTRMAVRRLKKT
jgi:tyrosinase